MMNFDRIKSKNFEQMVHLLDRLVDGHCDNCPAYNLCAKDQRQYTIYNCKPYFRSWLILEEETEDLLADDPIK